MINYKNKIPIEFKKRKTLPKSCTYWEEGGLSSRILSIVNSVTSTSKHETMDHTRDWHHILTENLKIHFTLKPIYQIFLVVRCTDLHDTTNFLLYYEFITTIPLPLFHYMHYFLEQY